MLDRPLNGATAAAQIPALAVIVIAMFGILGYAYGVDRLYSIARLTTIAVHTAVALLLLGVAVLCARPESNVLAVLCRDDEAGTMSRRLLLPAILLPFVVGWLVAAGGHRGWYDTEFAASIMAIALIFGLALLTWWATRGLGVAVDHRRGSEKQVRRKLEAVLAPEGGLGSLELADIIDVPAIQSLMDSFYKLAGVPMSILDLKGQVLVGVGWQEICTRFHRAHPKTCKHCVESDTQLSAGIAPGQFRLYKCKNNMWDISTPIMVGGQHVGNVFSGQFFFDDEQPDEELFRRQARRYGFDEQAYVAAMKAVPRLSRQTVQTGMAFFIKFAQIISQLSYGNIKLARSLAQRDALTDSLRQSQERMNRAQEIAHLGSWELDVLANRLSWSDEVYRIFGLAPQQFAATYEAFLEAAHPEDRAAVDAAYSGSVRAGRDSYEIEHRLVRRSTGEVRIVHEKCEHLRDETGRIIRSVGMVHDITERKQAEQELRRTAEELARSNKELEQFAYVAAHDLQEPLRMVAGFVSRLEARYRDALDETAREYLLFAAEGAQRMSTLVRDLLEYSRLQPPVDLHRPVQMGQVCRKAIDNCRPEVEAANAQVAAGEMPTVHGDETQLVLLVHNLLSNALKFRRDGVRPKIQLEARPGGGGQGWVFSVKDNGIGIPAEQQERVFRIFQRLHTRDKHPGNGIGLAIAKKIVEHHGGRIWIESTAAGSTFCFTLR